MAAWAATADGDTPSYSAIAQATILSYLRIAYAIYLLAGFVRLDL